MTIVAEMMANLTYDPHWSLASDGTATIRDQIVDHIQRAIGSGERMDAAWCLNEIVELAKLVDGALAAKVGTENSELLERQAFVKQYAERSDLTVEEPHDLGQRAYPCDCGEPGCKGWRMGGIGEGRAGHVCSI